MHFHKLINRYKQFGGSRLVVEYAKLGVLGTVVKGFFRCLIKRQSFKQIYPAVLKKVESFLIKRYYPIVQQFKSPKVQVQEFENSRIVSPNTDGSDGTDNFIWFCWLQGIEQAPAIVKACYNSLQKHLVQEFKVQGVQENEIKVIDAKNWREYVELPDYIVEKWNNKRIPAALFSDLLRLELLIKYGGTWIDSTVLCTGFKGSKVQEFKKYLDADLFLFQYTMKGSVPVSISNWFISSCPNNEVLMVLREMLYAYWKEYDCTLDYYIFHLFFSVIAKEYPEEIAKMPYGYSPNSLVLLHHWGEKYKQQKWDKLTSQVSFHKLTFRVSQNVIEDKDNYYNYILSEYGRI